MKVPGTLFIVFVMALNPVANANEEMTVHQFLRRDSVPVNMLIINSFDAMSMKIRKNKKELFRDLADSLKQVLSLSTPPPEGGTLIVIPELIKNSGDSAFFLLMARTNASNAIVIKNIDAFFDQTDVEVTREEGGKVRNASYDICAIINYRLYKTNGDFNDSEIRTCEFFTKRSVMSGLLAAGPDIVGKKEAAFKIVRKNALQYIAKETPWK